MKKKTLIVYRLLVILGAVVVYFIGTTIRWKHVTNIESFVNSIPVITNDNELSKDMNANTNEHEVFICGEISSVTTIKYDEHPDEDYILVKEIYKTKDDGEYKITKENVETALYARILDSYINLNNIIFINSNIDAIENIDDNTRKEYKIIKNNSKGVLHAQIKNG